MKNIKKFLVAVLTIMFVLTLSQAAFAGYSVLPYYEVVPDGETVRLGKIIGKFLSEQINTGDRVIISLPRGFKLKADREENARDMTKSDWLQTGYSVWEDAYFAGMFRKEDYYISVSKDEKIWRRKKQGNCVLIPLSVDEEDNGLIVQGRFIFRIEMPYSNELHLIFADEPEENTKWCKFIVCLNAVYVPEGFTGDIIATIDAPGGSALKGTVVLGKVDELLAEEAEPAAGQSLEEPKPKSGKINRLDKQHATEKTKIVFRIGEFWYKVDGEKREMDAAPYIKNDRTYVPVRYAGIALEINERNIRWENGTVELARNLKEVIWITPGRNVLYTRKKVVEMDVSPEIKDGRVMLPLRWVAEAFGAEVLWDGDKKTVTVIP